MLAHKVVFFRGQHLDHGDQVAFARQFGQLLARQRPQSGGALDEFCEVWTISPQADVAAYGLDHEALYRQRRTGAQAGWHTDLSDSVNPPAASVLRAESVPSYGGHPVGEPRRRLRRPVGAGAAATMPLSSGDAARSCLASCTSSRARLSIRSTHCCSPVAQPPRPSRARAAPDR